MYTTKIPLVSKNEICTPERMEGFDLEPLIAYDRLMGNDYETLHCLLRAFNPNKVIEVGTHLGRGTKVICDAVAAEAAVYSVELFESLAHLVSVHPMERTGECAKGRYTQFWADEIGRIDYYPKSDLPMSAVWFIDGEHSYSSVMRDTERAVTSNAPLIIYHDFKKEGVATAVVNTLPERYELWCVENTRMGFAFHGREPKGFTLTVIAMGNLEHYELGD